MQSDKKKKKKRKEKKWKRSDETPALTLVVNTWLAKAVRPVCSMKSSKRVGGGNSPSWERTMARLFLDPLARCVENTIFPCGWFCRTFRHSLATSGTVPLFLIESFGPDFLPKHAGINILEVFGSSGISTDQGQFFWSISPPTAEIRVTPLPKFRLGPWLATISPIKSNRDIHTADSYILSLLRDGARSRRSFLAGHSSRGRFQFSFLFSFARANDVGRKRIFSSEKRERELKDEGNKRCVADKRSR